MTVWSSAELIDAAETGRATPDGTFPVDDVDDLLRGLTAAGRIEPDRLFPVLTHLFRRGDEIGITASTIRRMADSVDNVADVVGRLWNEDLHPRGRDGKFIEVGAFVHIVDSNGTPTSSGRIVDFGDGSVEVRDAEGNTRQVKSREIKTVTTKASLGEPSSSSGNPLDYDPQQTVSDAADAAAGIVDPIEDTEGPSDYERMMTEFTIRTDMLEYAQKLVDKANKRAKRSGIDDQFEFEVYETFDKDISPPGETIKTYLSMSKIRLNRPTLQHEGYTFVATLTWDAESGLITRVAPGQDLKRRPQERHCDVCKSKRDRKDTYVVQGPDGEQHQIGSNCLQQFMGMKPGNLWMLGWNDLAGLEKSTDDFDGDQGRPKRHEVRWSTVNVLAVTLAVVRRHGWLSKSNAGYDQTPTADHLPDILDGRVVGNDRDGSQRRYIEAVREEAQELLPEAEALRARIAELDGDSEYITNLKAVAAAETVSYRNLALLASAYVADSQKRERVEKAKVTSESVWIGDAGDKIDGVQARVTGVRYLEGDYGTTTLLTFVTPEGNVIKWFASGSKDYEIGDQVSIKATIKKQTEFNGVKETQILRAKLTPIDDEKPSLGEPGSSSALDDPVTVYGHKPEWIVGDDYDVNRDRQTAWSRRVAHALGVGDLTAQQAQSLGYYGGSGHDRDSNGDLAYKPLPEKMYHVTTAAGAVRREGLKSRAELGQQNGKGLGGGDDTTISITTERDLADSMLISLHEFHDVLTGAVSLEDLIEHARTGDDANEPYIHSLMYGFGNKDWKEGDPYPQGLADALAGRNHVRGGPPKSKEEIEALGGTPIYSPLDTESTTQFWEYYLPLDEDTLLYKRADVFKAYSMWRQQAGGRQDPLFFSTDLRGFRDLDPTDFDVIELEPATPRAQGYQMGSLAEWRVPTGDALRVVGRPSLGEPGSDTDSGTTVVRQRVDKTFQNPTIMVDGVPRKVAKIHKHERSVVSDYTITLDERDGEQFTVPYNHYLDVVQPLATQNTDVVITSVVPETSSDYPRVTVEPYRVTTDGGDVIVESFWLNGSYVSTTGHKVKKDGTRGPKANSLRVPMPPEVREALNTLAGKPSLGEPSSEQPYRMEHTAPTAEYGDSAVNMLTVWPDDVFTRPEIYTSDNDSELFQQLKLIQNGKPDDEIVVYRTMPPDVGGIINEDDWVSLTYHWAEIHGFDTEVGGDDWPVYATTVRLDSLFTDGNDLHEWGFGGKDGTRGVLVKGPVIPGAVIRAEAEAAGPPTAGDEGTPDTFTGSKEMSPVDFISKVRTKRAAVPEVDKIGKVEARPDLDPRVQSAQEMVAEAELMLGLAQMLRDRVLYGDHKPSFRDVDPKLLDKYGFTAIQIDDLVGQHDIGEGSLHLVLNGWRRWLKGDAGVGHHAFNDGDSDLWDSASVTDSATGWYPDPYSDNLPLNIRGPREVEIKRSLQQSIQEAQDQVDRRVDRFNDVVEIHEQKYAGEDFYDIDPKDGGPGPVAAAHYRAVVDLGEEINTEVERRVRIKYGATASEKEKQYEAEYQEQQAKITEFSTRVTELRELYRQPLYEREGVKDYHELTRKYWDDNAGLHAIMDEWKFYGIPTKINEWIDREWSKLEEVRPTSTRTEVGQYQDEALIARQVMREAGIQFGPPVGSVDAHGLVVPPRMLNNYTTVEEQDVEQYQQYLDSQSLQTEFFRGLSPEQQAVMIQATATDPDSPTRLRAVFTDPEVGVAVQLRTDNVTSSMARSVLGFFSTLGRIDPLPNGKTLDVTIRELDPTETKGGIDSDGEALAYTVNSDSLGSVSMVLSPTLFDITAVNTEGWMRSALLTTGIIGSVLAHEYGHARERSGERDRMTVMDGMSDYGLTDKREAYAEAYVEFIGSGGKSDNPSVVAAAQEFGWVPKGDGQRLFDPDEGTNPPYFFLNNRHVKAADLKVGMVMAYDAFPSGMDKRDLYGRITAIEPYTGYGAEDGEWVEVTLAVNSQGIYDGAAYRNNRGGLEYRRLTIPLDGSGRMVGDVPGVDDEFITPKQRKTYTNFQAAWSGIPTEVLRQIWKTQPAVTMNVDLLNRGQRNAHVLWLHSTESSKATMVHEEHHGWEFSAPWLRFLEFNALHGMAYEGEPGQRKVRKGTAKTPRKYRVSKLKTIMKGWGYKDEEVAIQDDLKDAYQGKVYAGSDFWHDNGTRAKATADVTAAEVITMESEMVGGSRLDFEVGESEATTARQRELRNLYYGAVLTQALPSQEEQEFTPSDITDTKPVPEFVPEGDLVPEVPEPADADALPDLGEPGAPSVPLPDGVEISRESVENALIDAAEISNDGGGFDEIDFDLFTTEETRRMKSKIAQNIVNRDWDWDNLTDEDKESFRQFMLAWVADGGGNRTAAETIDGDWSAPFDPDKPLVPDPYAATEDPWVVVRTLSGVEQTPLSHLYSRTRGIRLIPIPPGGGGGKPPLVDIWRLHTNDPAFDDGIPLEEMQKITYGELEEALSRVAEFYQNNGPGLDYSDELGEIEVHLRGTDGAKRLLAEMMASKIVATWATSSNDGNAMSHLIQDRAAETLGITDAAKWKFYPYDTELQDKIKTITDRFADIDGLKWIDRFLEGRRAATQDAVDPYGTGYVTLYRGVQAASESIGIKTREEGQISDEQYWTEKQRSPMSYTEKVPVDLQLRPLSSWSLSSAVADRFAAGNGGVIRLQVPTDRLAGSYGTGLGCANENEMVILGGKYRAEMIPAGVGWGTGEFIEWGEREREIEIVNFGTDRLQTLVDNAPYKTPSSRSGLVGNRAEIKFDSTGLQLARDPESDDDPYVFPGYVEFDNAANRLGVLFLNVGRVRDSAGTDRTYKTHLTRLEMIRTESGNQTILVYGDISIEEESSRHRTSEWEKVGHFTRRFELIDDEWVVHHVSAGLEPQYRGQGIMTGLNRRAENGYIKAGIKEVRVYANLSVGGYAWAKAGFDWDTEGRDIYGEMREIVDRLRRDYPEDTSVADRLIRFLDGGEEEDAPTPFEVAMVGYNDPRVTKSGIEAREAVMRLNAENSTVTDVREALRLIRDANRWGRITPDIRDSMTTAIDGFEAELENDPEMTSLIGPLRVNAGLQSGMKLTWPGKKVMIGASWSGVKYLVPPPADVEIDVPSGSMETNSTGMGGV